MKKYDKLVRDKIPEIIEKNGDEFEIHIADEEEYWGKLKEKLLEEVNEFIEEENKEEMADVYEVLEAISNFKKYSKESIEKIKIEKARKRGKFNKKIILDKS